MTRELHKEYGYRIMNKQQILEALEQMNFNP